MFLCRNGLRTCRLAPCECIWRCRLSQDRGVLRPGDLDEHAQSMLRQSDPDIALEALEQWERLGARTEAGMDSNDE